MDLLLNRRRMLLNAEKEEYIVFADPVVEQICASNWGDGVGLKPSQAALVTSLGTVFRANTNIVSFDELEYFTSLTTISGGSGNSAGAFYGCTSLASVALPPSCTTIQGYAFQGCTALESCTGGNVTSFGNYCFQGCSSLINVNLSNAISIGNSAFYNAGLDGKTLHLPNLTSLSSYAFRNTKIASITSLGSITSLPDGNNTDNYGVFSGCTSLTSVVLPNTLTTAGICAFYNCTSLDTVNIPTSLTTMKQKVFRGCPLTSETGVLTITQNIALNSATFWGNKFTKIVFEGNVSGLSGSLNGSLSTLYSTTLLELDFSANQTNGLGSYIVRNPSGQTGCPITTLTVRATTPPTVTNYTFNGMSRLAHIYVPASAVDTYKAASGWSGKASIISAIPE